MIKTRWHSGCQRSNSTLVSAGSNTIALFNWFALLHNKLCIFCIICIIYRLCSYSIRCTCRSNFKNKHVFNTHVILCLWMFYFQGIVHFIVFLNVSYLLYSCIGMRIRLHGLLSLELFYATRSRHLGSQDLERLLTPLSAHSFQYKFAEFSCK